MIIRNKISKEEIEKIFENSFKTMIKIVVDIEREILAAGCELHIDCAEELAEDGSHSKDLWGANLYHDDLSIDFVSLLNIKPIADNRSMDIQNPIIKERAENIILALLV